MADIAYREWRILALICAGQTPGYDTPRLDPLFNVGRVVMQKRYGPWRGGFYPRNHPEFEAMERHYKAKHKKTCMALPK